MFHLLVLLARLPEGALHHHVTWINKIYFLWSKYIKINLHRSFQMFCGEKKWICRDATTVRGLSKENNIYRLSYLFFFSFDKLANIIQLYLSKFNNTVESYKRFLHVANAFSFCWFGLGCGGGPMDSLLRSQRKDKWLMSIHWENTLLRG